MIGWNVGVFIPVEIWFYQVTIRFHLNLSRLLTGAASSHVKGDVSARGEVMKGKKQQMMSCQQ